MKPVDNSRSVQNIISVFEDFKNKSLKSNSPKDAIEISNTAKVFSALDNFLNLGNPDRLDIGKLNGAEKEEFLKMLSSTLKSGFVGYEVLEVNGKPEKHDIVMQIGDQRLKGAKLYKKNNVHK